MKNERKCLVKKDDLLIPIPPERREMNETYFSFIERVKKEVENRKLEIVLQANVSMICLYWNIGKLIIEMQEKEGWGTKVIDRISYDLKCSFPEMNGFSTRNIKYMRKFAKEWSDYQFVQQVVAQIPWGTNIVLLDKLENEKERVWYAQKVLENGWSRSVLELQIQSKLMKRSGKTVNNFKVSVPPKESDMVNQIFKDPYLFDFLGTEIPSKERDIENQLTEHIQKFLIELGQGFAFVGRQVHIEVGGQDFYLDLLFYHLKLRCYIVIELKARDFEPAYISQLNMYQNMVNDLLRHPSDNPTIGLLLVKGKNKTIVEYSLAGYNNPIGVAEWKERLTKELNIEIKNSLPTVEEFENEMESC